MEIVSIGGGEIVYEVLKSVALCRSASGGGIFELYHPQGYA